MQKIFLVFFSLIFIFSITGGMFHNRGLLFGERVVTSATVTSYEPLNHSSVYYKYTACDLLYEGMTMTEGYSEGDKITIEYLKKKPWVSEFNEAIPTSFSFILSKIVGSLFLAGSASLVWHFKNKPGL